MRVRFVCPSEPAVDRSFGFIQELPRRGDKIEVADGDPEFAPGTYGVLGIFWQLDPAAADNVDWIALKPEVTIWLRRE